MGYLRNRNGVSFYGPSQILINSGGTLNVSVGNVETILTSLTIPANTFVTGDCINIISRIVKTTTNDITTIIMRIGTTGTLSDNFAGIYTSLASTDTIIPIFRTIGYYGGFADTNFLMDSVDDLLSIDVTGNSGVILLGINWGVNQIITISAVNAVNADNMNGMFIKTKVV